MSVLEQPCPSSLLASTALTGTPLSPVAVGTRPAGMTVVFLSQGHFGWHCPFPAFPLPGSSPAAPGGFGASAGSCPEAAWPRFGDGRAGGRLCFLLISQTNSLGHVPAPRGAAGPGWWLPDLIGSVCSADGWRGRGAGAFTCARGSIPTCRDPGQHPDPAGPRAAPTPRGIQRSPYPSGVSPPPPAPAPAASRPPHSRLLPPSPALPFSPCRYLPP